jgi:hypothetical protein
MDYSNKYSISTNSHAPCSAAAPLLILGPELLELFLSGVLLVLWQRERHRCYLLFRNEMLPVIISVMKASS